MGLFDKALSFLGISKVPGENIEQTLQRHPVQAAVIAVPAITLASAGLLGTAITTAAVKAAPIISKTVETVGKTVITAVTHPKETINTLLGATGTLAAGSFLVGSASTREQVIKAPGAIADFSYDAGKLKDNPTLEGAKNLVTEHPFISGALALAGVSIISKAYSTVATIANTDALKKGNELLKETIDDTKDKIPNFDTPPATPLAEPEWMKQYQADFKKTREEQAVVAPIAAVAPITPAVKKKAAPKKKKKAKKAAPKKKKKAKKAAPKKKKKAKKAKKYIKKKKSKRKR